MFLAIANSVSSLIKPYISKITSALAARSDYYENIKGTNNILFNFGAKLLDKASIVLTPTAYSDGSLNTVIPPYAPSYINNIPFVTSEWGSLQEGWSIDEANNKLVAEATWTGINKTATFGGFGDYVGKTVKVSFDAVVTAGSFDIYRPFITSNISESGSYSFTKTSVDGRLRFRNRSTDFAGEITNIKFEVIEEADFDFSRGSSATRVNEQGLIEDIQILSGNLVQNGDFEEIGSEVSNDVNFDNPSNWSLTGQSTVSNGKAHIVQNDSSNTGITANTTITNKTYKITGVVSDYISGSVGFASLGSTSPRVAIPSENGAFTIYYTSTRSTPSTWNIQRISSPCDLKLDNVSVKEVGQNWTPNTNATLSIDSGRLKVAISGGSGYPSQNITTEVGKTYKVTADAFIGTSSRLAFFTNADSQFRNLYADGSFNFTFVATSTSTQLRLYVYDDGAYGFWDNVSVVKVTNDTDLPRIDFTDGTGSLLLEPQRTNLLTYSEDFSQWSSGGVTITPNSTISPDGTQNASLFSHSGGSFPQIALSGITFVSSADYAPSLYVKSDGTTQVQHSLIVNGQVVNFTPTNEWVRVSDLIVSPDTSGSFVIAQNSGSAVSASFYIWGAQLEQGSYATSYIPTNGSTVTRSADVCNNSGNADLINSTEGVLYFEGSALDTTNDFEFGLYGDSIAEQCRMVFQNGIVRAQLYNGAYQTLMSYTFDLTNNSKIAFKFKENDFALWINGTEVVTDNLGTTFSVDTLEKLNLANVGGTVKRMTANVKCVAVFKEALTDAELERLTG